MSRKTKKRSGRWAERAMQVEVVSPYADGAPTPREPRTFDDSARRGPYEASYDIALGYGHDRSILLP
ncbi:MAG TPA: hypothetical protein VK933_08595 [Longimicrobiales bacterium]|nr:hypothetical protein [Longimicrobiales bacterium]